MHITFYLAVLNQQVYASLYCESITAAFLHITYYGNRSYFHCNKRIRDW